MNCPLCNTELFNIPNDLYANCTTCNAYVKDELTLLSHKEEKEIYDKHVNDVTDVGYQNFTSPITNTILENFLPHHSGLDFGCGRGPVITTMLQKDGYDVTLFDPYYHPNENYSDKMYDYIFSCEVFEHFYCPKKEIEKLLSLLNRNGLLLIMTELFDEEKDFSKWYYRKDPTHVFIYTKKTMEYIAKTYNVQLVKMTDRLIVFKKS